MTDVFLSCSDDDRYFVDLLIALLTFHGVPVQGSVDSPTADGAWDQATQTAMESTNTLVVVNSQNAVLSPSIKREVALFLTLKPGAPVIFVQLDPTTSAQVIEHITISHSADFTSSLLTGFKSLFQALAIAFLPSDTLLVSKTRRAGTDRRQQEDRRKSPIDVRLRRGFWKVYQMATGASEFDATKSVGARMHKVRESITPEAIKYRYFLDDKPVDVNDVLTAACAHSYETNSAKEPGISVPAVHLIDEVVTFICRTYQVSMIDRRRGERRRLSDDPQ